MRLCLAAGKVQNLAIKAGLLQHFEGNGWRFISPDEVVRELQRCVDASYENDVAFVTAKILGRRHKSRSHGT